jgi:hypothetical protein
MLRALALGQRKHVFIRRAHAAPIRISCTAQAQAIARDEEGA